MFASLAMAPNVPNCFPLYILEVAHRYMNVWTTPSKQQFFVHFSPKLKVVISFTATHARVGNSMYHKACQTDTTHI